jgi:hypothetical protein
LNEKMKKVLFLMFLLFLFLGIANVKAQVRIGGNTPPSAGTVLDLNATNDSNLATGGLVLPRVDLQNNTMQLTSGVANQTGTMVYNVTDRLGKIGVYYWDGTSWVLASLPSTSTSDAGKILKSTGNSWTTDSLLKTVSATVTVAAGIRVVAGPECGAGWIPLVTYFDRPHAGAYFWHLMPLSTGVPPAFAVVSSDANLMLAFSAPATPVTFTGEVVCIKK